MKIQTIKRSLRTITNPSKIESLENASSGDRLKLRQGYESLLERNIEELQDPDTLVDSATCAFRRFFSTLYSNFYHDWPDPVKDKSQQSTSLSLARGIAGIVLLLRSNYIEEGRDWQDVESDFADLKQNLLSLRNISEDKYENGDVIILDSTTKPIPGSSTTRHDFCRFFIRNISSPTSIQDI